MTTIPTLVGRGVRLEPLAAKHAPALAPLVDAALWAGMTTPLPDTPEAMEQHVVGLAGIDTRALVRHLRTRGSMRAGVFSGDALVWKGDDL